MARGDCIQPEDLPPLREAPTRAAPVRQHQTIAEMERHMILETLRELGGNRTASAMRLGITVRTLQNNLKKYCQDFPESNAQSAIL